MAYSTSNPPILVRKALGFQTGAQQGAYTNTDTVATVRVASYITDGGNLGMKVGDLVEYYDSTLGITSTMNVATVSSTSPGAVDLQDATTIGSTTNTD